MGVKIAVRAHTAPFPDTSLASRDELLAISESLSNVTAILNDSHSAHETDLFFTFTLFCALPRTINLYDFRPWYLRDSRNGNPLLYRRRRELLRCHLQETTVFKSSRFGVPIAIPTNLVFQLRRTLERVCLRSWPRSWPHCRPHVCLQHSKKR